MKKTDIEFKLPTSVTTSLSKLLRFALTLDEWMDAQCAQVQASQYDEETHVVGNGEHVRRTLPASLTLKSVHEMQAEFGKLCREVMCG